MAYDFSISSGTTSVVDFHKKWLSWGDSYEIAIHADQNIEFFIALVVMIDDCLHDNEGESNGIHVGHADADIPSRANQSIRSCHPNPHVPADDLNRPMDISFLYPSVSVDSDEDGAKRLESPPDVSIRQKTENDRKTSSFRENVV
ncbi:MAG: hypothetical protein M0C28_18325 [Candidatus Moduliflexus flocculans]|nr:hypothetical protein [Candidatus Moduliflexus flocculans]